MFLACAFAHVLVVVTTLMNCFEVIFLPVGMVSIDVVPVNPFLPDEFQPTGCTFMALLFESFRGFAVIEFAVTRTERK